MADIDYPSGVVFVPKTDMVLVQSEPIPIYNHSLEDLYKELRSKEDSEEGRAFPISLEYEPPKSPNAANMTIKDYYTFTYEDGQYAVNLVGMNSNVGDRVNVNQVSIRSNNSSGLVYLPTMISVAFANGVYYDNEEGQAGTAVPLGTQGTPSNNWADAKTIASKENTKDIVILGTSTLTKGDDVSNMRIKGTNPLTDILIVHADAITTNLFVIGTYFMGSLANDTILRDCILGQVYYKSGYIQHCALTSNIIYISGYAVFINCRAGATNTSAPILDLRDSLGLSIPGYIGNLKLVEKDDDNIDMITISGEIEIDSTCVNGTINIFGNGYVIDNSGDGCTVNDYTIGNPKEIAKAVLDEIA